MSGKHGASYSTGLETQAGEKEYERDEESEAKDTESDYNTYTIIFAITTIHTQLSFTSIITCNIANFNHPSLILNPVVIF